jgi:geranylgeranyl diphosphate synthase type I
MSQQSPLSTAPTSTLLAAYKEDINEALETFFSEVPDMLSLGLSAVSKDALVKLQEYTLRPGKRIRGALGAAAYDRTGQTEHAPAGIALGVALELMQSYLLIVDDVMDESDLRRGQPTVHREYVRQADQIGDKHEANMLAINVGLIAQHLANLVLIRVTERPERLVSSLWRMHLNITATGFGQIDDMYQRVGRTVTEQDVVRKYYLKSSYYTFVNPLQAGLALAGKADEASLRKIKAFGEPAGAAFQLHDDYLGVFGDAPETGKMNIDDLKEGKYTMLVHYALKHGKPEEVAVLRSLLGNKNIRQADVAQARDIFTRTGAKKFVETEAKRYAATAQQHLEQMKIWDDAFKSMLADLVTYSISRQS